MRCLLLGLGLAALAFGCDDGDEAPLDAGGLDRGRVDARPVDAAVDIPFDAPLDAEVDAVVDAALDAAPDADRDGPLPDAAPIDATPPDAAVDAIPPTDPFVLYPGCRSDVFFVEVPLLGAPFGHDDPAVRADLLAALEARVAADRSWFCEADDANCAARPITPRVVSLIEPGPGTPANIAAALTARFMRVVFTHDATPVRVRPEALCDVVATIRANVPEGIHVGRECDLSPQGVEGLAADPRNPMRHWHLARLGLAPVLDGRTPIAYTPPSLPGLRPEAVRLVVIDTGLDPQVADRLRAANEIDRTTGGPRHPHGTGMTLLAHQVMPDAQVVPDRILDGQGVGSTGALAQALHHALFELPRPVIVNLSLGWPAELSSPRALTGEDGCETIEDGVGEAARYVLWEARSVQMERGPALVVAAAGNRPPEGVIADLFDDNGAAAACEIEGVPGPPWRFMPAEWGRRSSCVIADSPDAPFETTDVLLLPVGAVDGLDRPAGVSIAGAEPALVAPGEHVYAWLDDDPRLPADPACDGAAADPGLRLPAVYSGTSAATALMSGAAAFVAAHWTALNQQRRQNRLPALPALTAKLLARLLYVSGAPVCAGPDDGANRFNSTGTPVRRVDVGALVELLQCPDLHLTAECLLDQEGSGLWGAAGDVDLRCAAACPLPGRRCTPVEGAVTAWPDAYEDQVPACAPRPPGELRATACRDGVCAVTDLPNRFDLGSAGPQPIHPLCPECALFAFRNPGDDLTRVLRLELQINPKLDLGTQVFGAWLKVEGVGSWDLAPQADFAAWKPGAAIEVEFVPTQGVAQYPIGTWTRGKVTLITDIKAPDGDVSADTSPLRVFIKQ